MKSGLGAISALPATHSGLSGLGRVRRITAPAAGELILKKHGPVLLKGIFGDGVVTQTKQKARSKTCPASPDAKALHADIYSSSLQLKVLLLYRIVSNL